MLFGFFLLWCEWFLWCEVVVGVFVVLDVIGEHGGVGWCGDGGGVLEVTWLPAEDAAWNGYRIFVWDATGRESWNPSEDELDDFSTYITVPFWSQTSVMVTEADNDGVAETLSDDRLYRAAIAIEYPDGTLGDAIAWPGSVTPTDEMPNPPEAVL